MADPGEGWYPQSLSPGDPINSGILSKDVWTMESVRTGYQSSPTTAFQEDDLEKEI